MLKLEVRTARRHTLVTEHIVVFDTWTFSFIELTASKVWISSFGSTANFQAGSQSSSSFWTLRDAGLSSGVFLNSSSRSFKLSKVYSNACHWLVLVTSGDQLLADLKLPVANNCMCTSSRHSPSGYRVSIALNRLSWCYPSSIVGPIKRWLLFVFIAAVLIRSEPFKFAQA